MTVQIDIDEDEFRARFEQQRRAFLDAYEAALLRLAELGRRIAAMSERMAGGFHDWAPHRWHEGAGIKRSRCPRCVPAFARIKPLPIDGAALRRRQKNRARRRR